MRDKHVVVRAAAAAGGCVRGSGGDSGSEAAAAGGDEGRAGWEEWRAAEKNKSVKKREGKKRCITRHSRPTVGAVATCCYIYM